MTEIMEDTIVRVYKDPLTCKNLEGMARLIDWMGDEHDFLLERWTVHFIGDPPGQIVQRAINREYH